MNLIENLKNLGVHFVSPFKLDIEGQEHQVELLIRGFGARNGMIIEKSWEKIKPISLWLTNNGYGFCCFNSSEPCSLTETLNLLEDWGCNNAQESD